MSDVLAAGTVGHVPYYTSIRDHIRNDIVAGVFEDDQHLVLAQLCRRYGVSMPPIREALNQLQVEGLVVLEANRGARVRRISPEFITELFEIRVVLEPALVRRSIPHFRPEDVVALEAVQAGFEAAIAARDHPAVLRGNHLFHETIYRVHPNEEAIRLLRHHASVIAVMRNRFGYHLGRFGQIVAEHRALIRACADHDAPSAVAIAQSHIEHSVADLLCQMRQATPPAADGVPGLAGG
jgi:DNA-binding GntR family transcriptional regulator